MLKLRNKIGYGVGDLASNLMFQLSLLFLLPFYTDVAGIAPLAIAIIFPAARIWDAINDPMMGVIIDRTKSQFGHSRIYLRYASLPLALATVLVFLVPDFHPNLKVAYVAVTYILWGMLYTMVNIPYSSMTAELTEDPAERTSLSSVRMLFMLLGVVIVSVATEPLLGLFSTPRKGYLFVAVLYGLLGFIFFQICFAGTKNIKPRNESSQKKYTLAQALKILGKNSQLIILSSAFLLGASAEYIRETSVVYFVTYNMGDDSLISVFLGIVVLSMVVGNLVIPYATKKFDKKGTYYIGAAIAVAASIVFHFIPFDNHILIFVFAAVSSFGFTVFSTLGWAMLPDTVEFGEWKTGIRTEGIIYSFFSFSQKLATAIAGGLVALILHLTGYIANGEVQPPAALTGILSTLTIIPIAFIILSVVIIHFYSLDKKKFEEIKESLDSKAV